MDGPLSIMNDSNAPSRSNEVRIEKMLKNMAYSHSIHTKGQIISKANYGVFNSPKNLYSEAIEKMLSIKVS